MNTLPEGSYDVIVIEAEPTEDGDVSVELTITMGAHIGRIVSLRGHQIDGAAFELHVDPSALLGIPGTLHVRNGTLTFRPEMP